MAGSLSLSLSQQFDSLGEPLNGGLLYFYAAGTTTPQSAYKDVALTLAHPNPIELDAAGRVPAFYLADGQIKIRLTDALGNTQITADNLLVIGPSSGSGSPPSVDSTTLFQTGDVKATYGTGVVTGFVRLNGRTIGSASSGASERANADTQSLFEFLWNNDSNLSVSTGRGGSATADFAANKTITLPDARSRALFGLGDMGNSDNALFSGVTFSSGSSTALGSKLGAARETLLSTNLPTSLTTSTQAVVAVHTNTLAYQPGASLITYYDILTLGNPSLPGNSTAFDMVSPGLLITLYIKL